jgi:hypothetical protein
MASSGSEVLSASKNVPTKDFPSPLFSAICSANPGIKSAATTINKA